MNLTDALSEMGSRSSAVVFEVTTEMWGAPGYDEEHMARKDFAAKVGPSIELVLEHMATDAPLSEPNLNHARAIGEARALQGVPIDTVLHSWMAVQRVLMSRLLDYTDQIPGGELADAARRLLALVEVLTWQSIEAYRQTRGDIATSYDGPTSDLVAALAGPDALSSGETVRRAQVAGARVNTEYVALAVGSVSGLQGVLPAQRLLHRSLRGRYADRVLVGQVQEFAILLVPTGGADEALDGYLTTALKEPSWPGRASVALGMVAPSLVEVGDSIRQALQAGEVAFALNNLDRVVRFVDVIPEVIALHNRELTDLLIAAKLGDLTDRPELIETLNAYLKNQLSVRRTAAAMHMHSNTVLYRLNKLRTALGQEFSESNALVDLGLALRAYQMRSA